MKTITVSLGGREYEIVQQTYRASREWRERFAQPVEQIVASLQLAGGLMNRPLETGQDVADVVTVIGQTLIGGLGKTLIGSIDLVADMLYAYAPNLALDRETIEANSYDDEIVRAFVRVLGLVYPFGEILAAIRGR